MVTGPGKSGQSFFAIHLVQWLGWRGYVNFDDERPAGDVDTGALLAGIDDLYGQPLEPVTP